MSYQAQGDPLQAHRSGDTSAKPQLLSTANFLPPPLPHDKPLKTSMGQRGTYAVRYTGGERRRAGERASDSPCSQGDGGKRSG